MSESTPTLGERAIELGLRTYSRFADRKTMPTNRRIFLESVLDRSREPITEAAFSPAELTTLGEIIRAKYVPIEPALFEYEKYLADALEKHVKAVATKNKDRIMYPNFASRYKEDLAAIRAYKQGKLTPTFLALAAGELDYPRSLALGRLNLAQRFNVKPAVGYEDYGIDPEQARVATAGDDPRAALHTTLGRFGYEVDSDTGALVVVDKYDFNPPISSITGKTKTPRQVWLDELPVTPEGGGSATYNLLRRYAGRTLPEGAGRDVRIRLNNLAPPPANELVRR